MNYTLQQPLIDPRGSYEREKSLGDLILLNINSVTDFLHEKLKPLLDSNKYTQMCQRQEHEMIIKTYLTCTDIDYIHENGLFRVEYKISVSYLNPETFEEEYIFDQIVIKHHVPYNGVFKHTKTKLVFLYDFENQNQRSQRILDNQ
jgi:hypothetical protein